jgi:hypothetical protein
VAQAVGLTLLTCVYESPFRNWTGRCVGFEVLTEVVIKSYFLLGHNALYSAESQLLTFNGLHGIMPQKIELFII